MPEGLHHRSLCWNQCACKEIFCELYVLAVGCDIPGRSTIVCIVCSCINVVNLRHCCDFPETFLIFCRHQSSCDPVTIYDTSSLAACDCCDIFIPVVYKFNNIVFNKVYIKVDAFFCNIVSNDIASPSSFTKLAPQDCIIIIRVSPPVASLVRRYLPVFS